MSLDPLFYSDDHDARIDYHRKLIAIAADRAARYAGMVQELIEIRDDDRAQAMRGALAEQMAAINKGFTDLARSLAELPAKRAAEHFGAINGKDKAEDHKRYDRLAEDAEADAAAGR